MKRSMVGIAGAALLLVAAAKVDAQDVPSVTVTREGGIATMTLVARSLSVTQRIGEDRVEVRLSEAGDEVALAADAAGNVVLQRRGRTHAFSIRTSSGSERTGVVALLAGSAAVRSFDAIMRSEWGRSATPAAAAFKGVQSMLWLLHGDYRPLLSFASDLRARRVSLMPVRRGTDCWANYEATVQDLFGELEGCLKTWNPFQTAWCAYSFDFKVSMALLDLIDCYF